MSESDRFIPGTVSSATQIVTELYEGWYAAMVRFATRSFGNLELAEEVVQEAFMELYKELRRGRSVTHPRAWVMRVVRRRVWRQFGAAGDEQLEHETLDSAESQPALRYQIEDIGELAMLVGKLTRREEEAVLLRAAGLGYAEIAKELELAKGTVSTLLSRALRKMQDAAQRKSASLGKGRHDRASDPSALL